MIWTLTNTHERQRNLRCCYTDCYTTSRLCFVIAVSPRPSANPECRVLEHQPVGPRPRRGGEQRPLPFRGMTHVVHPRGSRQIRSLLIGARVAAHLQRSARNAAIAAASSGAANALS